MRGVWLLVFLLVPLASMAQGPTIPLGVDRPDAEGITVTHAIEEIPPDAIYLGRDMHFEQVPNHDWYGLDDPYSFKTFLNPLDGVMHLRQWLDHSMVCQTISLVDCSPIHSVWVTGNVGIISAIEADMDVQEGIIFNALNGLSVATLWTRWNQPGMTGEYDEIRVRVDGLLQVTNLIRLCFGAEFSDPQPEPNWTRFDTDGLTAACLPIGWVQPEEYKVYLPYVGR